nr:extracellular solute-binding protein [Microbacterium esteraromaticum]
MLQRRCRGRERWRRCHALVRAVVAAGGQRPDGEARRRVRGGEPRHQDRAADRSVRRHQGSAGRRRSQRDAAGSDRPGWQLGLRPHQAGRARRSRRGVGGSDLIDSIEGVEVDGGTRMLNVVYATYVLFANTDILDAAGVEVPTTWDEFAEAARAVKASNPDVSPLALPLSLESPVGIKNDVLSWYWASEGSFRDGDGADLEDDDLAELLDYFAGLNEEGLIAPGLANMLEQDKVESFASGQTAMIVSATPHVNVIGERDQVNFTVGAIPTKDGFSGTPGATYASWGIGIADSSDHKEEAWKFVEFLLGAEQNGALATAANMFPANGDASPDESAMAENSVKAFEIWKQGAPVDEFLGLPAAEQLQRTLIEQVQQVLAGDEDATTGLSNAQVEWDDIIGG